MSTFQARFKGQISVTGRDGRARDYDTGTVTSSHGHQKPKAGRRSAGRRTGQGASPAPQQDWNSPANRNPRPKPTAADLARLDSESDAFPAFPARATPSMTSLGAPVSAARSSYTSDSDYAPHQGYGADTRQVQFAPQSQNQVQEVEGYGANQGYGSYGYSSSPAYTPGGGNQYAQQGYADPYQQEMEQGYGAQNGYANQNGYDNNMYQQQQQHAYAQGGYAPQMMDEYGEYGEQSPMYDQYGQQMPPRAPSVPAYYGQYNNQAIVDNDGYGHDPSGKPRKIQARSHSASLYTPSGPQARRRPGLTVSQKLRKEKEAQLKEKEEAHAKKQAQREKEDPLAFGRRVVRGTVKFKPKSGPVDRKIQKLGGLGPDLSNPELQEKKAKRDRMLAFSRSVKTVNKSVMPAANPPRNPKVAVIKPPELSARDRAKQFAESVRQRAKTTDGKLRDQTPVHKTKVPRAGRRAGQDSASPARVGITRGNMSLPQKDSAARRNIDFDDDSGEGYYDDDDFEPPDVDTSLQHLDELERQHMRSLAQVESIRREMGAY